jgi:co-chaperonin GroES (HSP10)
MTIIPVENNLLVERIVTQRKVGSLFAPDKGPGNTARVLAVGEGTRTAFGQFVSLTAVPGDEVILLPGVGREIEVDNQVYLFIKSQDIIGVVRR